MAMDWVQLLAERQMLAAQAKGQLQGLAGEGKPLPDRTADAFVPAAEAVAFRIMAEAGALPEEFRLAKACDALRAQIAGMDQPAARQAAMAELSQLEMRRAMAVEARRKFMRG
jgi:hypothetical protein